MNDIPEPPPIPDDTAEQIRQLIAEGLLKSPAAMALWLRDLGMEAAA
jgi:hypothetical protein